MESKYKVVPTKAFRKNLDKYIRKGKDITKLNEVVELLADGKPLPEKNRNHPLQGSFMGKKGCWECHIEPDWLLVYKKYRDELILELLRTGTHSELF